MRLDLQGTHIISNRKFAKGFEQNGYEIVEILSEVDVDKIENKLGNTGYRNSSQVLHKVHHDESDLIIFTVSEPEKLWKPILDFTLVEVD